MAVTPVPFVSATSAASSTTYTETVGTSTPQGAALVVVCGSSGSDTSTGVADSQGNTYTLVATSTTNENVQCYVALAAHALFGGVDTVTATWATATTQQKNIIGVYVQGAILRDLVASNSDSSSTASVAGGTPDYYNEVAIAIIQGGAAGSSFNAPAGYSFFAGQFPSGEQITALYYKYLPQPYAQSLTSALSVSQQWAMLFVTLYVAPLTAPSVPDFIAGYGPQQSDMQSLWAGPLAFFQNRVVFRAVEALTPTTLLSSGAGVTIGYDDVLEDPFGGWNPSAFEWTPPSGYSGVYQVTVTVYVVAPAAQQICLGVFVGGNAAYNQNSGVQLSQIVIPQQVAGVEGTETLRLAGGQDGVWGEAHIANSASNLNTNLAAGLQSSIEIIWISS